VTEKTRFFLSLLVIAAAARTGVAWTDAAAQQTDPPRREFTVIARRYAFTPAGIEVDHGDCVTITLTTEDIAHSFTIDEYRISKRIAPGQLVVVEFRADRRGTFTFYCSLTAEEGCRNMRGTLLVR
jgi:cytochrome c oxidase subunit II